MGIVKNCELIEENANKSEKILNAHANNINKHLEHTQTISSIFDRYVYF